MRNNIKFTNSTCIASIYFPSITFYVKIANLTDEIVENNAEKKSKSIVRINKLGLFKIKFMIE